MAKDGGIPMLRTLLQSGTTKVPNRFVKPAAERPSFFVEDSTQEVPVIDLKDLETQEGLSALANACKEWGLFHLVGHGIEPQLLEKVRDTAKEFFYLPEDEKKAYPIQGIEGYGRYFVHSEDAVIDWVDAFHHYVPPMFISWPSKPAHYRETVEAYADLIDNLLMFLALSLGQSGDLFVKRLNGPGSLRFNYYPPCPEPDMVMGLSPHTDALTSITVLIPDDKVRGLQVNKDGVWRWVNSVKGSLTVFIGDLMEIASNGEFKSLEHRAVVDGEHERLTVATFHMPARERVIKPLVVRPGCQPLFKESTMGELMDRFLNDVLKGKELLKLSEVK